MADAVNEAAEESVVSKPKKEKTVTIRIPRLSKNDDDVFVSINERTWLIKRGVDVEVPECVAKAIRNKEAMEEEAYEYDMSVQK